MLHVIPQFLHFKQQPKTKRSNKRKKLRQRIFFDLNRSVFGKLRKQNEIKKQNKMSFQEEIVSLRGGGIKCCCPKPSCQNTNIRITPNPEFRYFFENFSRHSEQINIASQQTSQDNYKEQILRHLQWFNMMKLTFIQHRDLIQFVDCTKVYFELLQSFQLVSIKNFLLGFDILKIANNFLINIVSFINLNQDQKLTNQRQFELVRDLIQFLGQNEDQSSEVIFQQLLLKQLLGCFQIEDRKEYLIKLADGLLKSVLSFSIQVDLIETLIGIGKDIYKTIKNSDEGAFETYVYFERLQIQIIQKLIVDQKLDVMVILRQLYSLQQELVIQQENWIFNMCWVRMISFLLSFYPILYNQEQVQRDINQKILIQSKIKESSFEELIWFIPKMQVPISNLAKLDKYSQKYQALHQFQLLLLKHLTNSGSKFFIINLDAEPEKILNYSKYFNQNNLSMQNKQQLLKEALNKQDKLIGGLSKTTVYHEAIEKIEKLIDLLFEIEVLIFDQQEITDWLLMRLEIFQSYVQISNPDQSNPIPNPVQQSANPQARLTEQPNDPKQKYKDFSSHFKKDFQNQFKQFQNAKFTLMAELIKYRENINLNNKKKDQSLVTKLQNDQYKFKNQTEQISTFFNKEGFEQLQQLKEQLVQSFSEKQIIINLEQNPYNHVYKLIMRYMMPYQLFLLMIAITQKIFTTQDKNINLQFQKQLVYEAKILLNENQSRIDFFISYCDLEQSNTPLYTDFKQQKAFIKQHLNYFLQLLKDLQSNCDDLQLVLSDPDQTETIIDRINQLIIKINKLTEEEMKIEKKGSNQESTQQTRTPPEKQFNILLYFFDQILTEQIGKLSSNVIEYQKNQGKDIKLSKEQKVKIFYIENLINIGAFEKEIDQNSQLAQFCDKQLYYLKFEEESPIIQKIIKDREKDDPLMKYLAFSQLRDIEQNNQYQLIQNYATMILQESHQDFYCKLQCFNKKKGNKITQDAFDKILGFLKNDQKHLLIITGPPGIGKTRLVLEVRQFLFKKNQKWVPLLYKLEEIQKLNFNFINASLELLSQSEKEIQGLRVEMQNQRIKLLIILVGYDRMNSERRQNFNIQKKLQTALQQRSVKFIITTRTHCFDEDFNITFFKNIELRYQLIEICKLNTNQKEQFIEIIAKSVFLNKFFQKFGQNCSVRHNYTYKDFEIEFSKFLPNPKTSQSDSESNCYSQSVNQNDLYRYLQQDQVNSLINYLSDNNLFKSPEEQYKQNLENFLQSMWSKLKFKQIINSSKISALLTTPFMFEIFKELFSENDEKRNNQLREIFDPMNLKNFSQFKQFEYFIEIYHRKCSQMNQQPQNFQKGLDIISENYALQLALKLQNKGMYNKEKNEIIGQFCDERDEIQQFFKLTRCVLWDQYQQQQNQNQQENIIQEIQEFQFIHESIREFFLGKYVLNIINKIQPINKNDFLAIIKNKEKDKQIFQNVDQLRNEISRFPQSVFNEQDFCISKSYFKPSLQLIKNELIQITKWKEKLITLVRLSSINDSFTRASSNSMYLLFFTQKNLGQLNLKGIRISDIDLSRANLSGIKLQNSIFQNVCIDGCNFSEANLSQVDWKIDINNEPMIFNSESVKKVFIPHKPQYLILMCQNQIIKLFDLQKGSIIEDENFRKKVLSKYYGLSLASLNGIDLLSKLHKVSDKQELSNQNQILNISFSSDTNLIAICKQDFIELFRAPKWSIRTIKIENSIFRENVKICFSDKYLCFDCFYKENQQFQDDPQQFTQQRIVIWDYNENEFIQDFDVNFIGFTISDNYLFIRDTLQQINRTNLQKQIIKEQNKNTKIFESFPIENQQNKIKDFKQNRHKYQYLQLMIISNDKRFLGFFIQDLIFQLRNVDNMNLYCSIQGLNQQDSDIAISPETKNNFLMAFNKNKSIIKIWNVYEQKQPQITENSNKFKTIDQFVISLDSSKIAISYQDQWIRIYTVETGDLLAEYKEHDSQILKIMFIPTGEALFSCCAGSILKLWNIREKKITLQKNLNHQVIDLKYCTNQNILLQINHFYYQLIDYLNDTQNDQNFSHPFIFNCFQQEKITFSPTGRFFSLLQNTQTYLFDKEKQIRKDDDVELDAFTSDEIFYVTIKKNELKKYSLKDNQVEEVLKGISYRYYPAHNILLLNQDDGKFFIFSLTASSNFFELNDYKKPLGSQLISSVKFSQFFTYFLIQYQSTSNYDCIQIWKVIKDYENQKTKKAIQINLPDDSFKRLKDVFFSPKSEFVVSIEWDFNCILNLQTMEKKKFKCSIQEDLSLQTGIIFIQDNVFSFFQYFYSSCYVKYIQINVNNIKDGETQFRIEEIISNDTINLFIVSADLYVFAVVFNKRFIKLWGKKEIVLDGHINDIKQIQFTPDNKILASSEANVILLWNLELGEKIGYYLGFNCIQINLSNQILYAKNEAGNYLFWNFLEIRFWDYESQLYYEKQDFFSFRNCKLAISLNKQFLASYDEKQIKIWNILQPISPSLIQILEMQKVNFVVFSPSDQIIAFSTLDAKLAVWNFRNNKFNLLKKNLNSKYIIIQLVFSDDGQILISKSTGEIRIWDVKLMILYYNLEQKDLMNIEISPNGKLLAYTYQDDIILWNIQQQGIIGQYESHVDKLEKLCFSANSSVLLLQMNNLEKIQCLKVEQERLNLIELQKPGRKIPFSYKQYNLKVIDSSQFQAQGSIICGSKLQSVSGYPLKNTFLQKGAKEYYLNIKELPKQQELIDQYLIQEQVEEISLENMQNTIQENYQFFENFVNDKILKNNNEIHEVEFLISDMKNKIQNLIECFIETEDLKLQLIKVCINDNDPYFYYLTLQKQEAEFKLNIFMLTKWQISNQKILDSFRSQKIKFPGIIYTVEYSHNLVQDSGKISLAVWYHLVIQKCYTIEQGMKIMSSTLAPYYVLYMKQN